MSFRGDFHVHSTLSDGTLTPRAVAERAHAAGVDLFALTDHDEVGGVTEAAQRGSELGVQVIPDRGWGSPAAAHPGARA